MNNQAMEALQRANDIRLGRAMIKKEIREGIISIVDVLESEPYVCDGMSILQLFTSQHRWAVKKSEDFIKHTLANPGKKLGELTSRERIRLIERYQEKYG